jgi:HD superfamily phosphohydrolase
MNSKPATKSSFFHDPVHGHIELSQLERTVVDTVEFQRLRFIRQLSLLHYVFPGAFHTRFAHSIGSCHNSKLVSDQLFTWSPEATNSYAIQVFRLASLLHDVGHGAFSHSLSHLQVKGRSFLPTFEEVQTNHEDWGFDPNDDTGFSKIISDAGKGHESKAIEHEVLSALIIKRIFEHVEKNRITKNGADLFESIPKDHWIQDICALVLHSDSYSESFASSSRDIFREDNNSIPDISNEGLNTDLIPTSLGNSLSKLVAGTVDCDRMDYLLRDSMNCGVNYGLFDRDGIISSMMLVAKDGRVEVAINAKRTNTLDDFLWSRYQMFRQVYCHKTANSYNVLLELALGDLVDQGTIYTPKNILDYLTLTDDLIMSKVFEAVVHSPNSGPWIEAFANRKLPEFLGVIDKPSDDDIWNESPNEIYFRSSLNLYDGWKTDQHRVHTVMKAEVVHDRAAEGDALPLLVSYNKKLGTWAPDNYLGKSVFFKTDLPLNERLGELKKRLNKKLMFFYKLN